MEAAEYSAKYKAYEKDYLRRINHKYFSGKNLAGTGLVFRLLAVRWEISFLTDICVQ